MFCTDQISLKILFKSAVMLVLLSVLTPLISKSIQSFSVFSYGSNNLPRLQLASEQGYQKGGLIALSSTEEPAIELGSWNKSGEAEIRLYEANQDQLLNYLIHDKDNKQTSGSIDTAGLQHIATLKQSVSTSDSANKIVLPLQPSGIYYMQIDFNGSKNDAFILRSKIGAIAKQGNNQIIVWGQNYETRRHLTDGTVHFYGLLNSKQEVATANLNDQGIAELPLTTSTDLAVIEQGSERAIIPINLKYLNTGYGYSPFQPKKKTAKYFAFTDRPLYKPGDMLHFKTILREDDDARYTIPGGTASVKIFKDWDEKKAIYDKVLPISNQGSVYGDFSLPKDLPVGYYTVQVKWSNEDTDYGWGTTTNFEVQYFRKPEYSIDVTSPKDEVIIGENPTFNITGSYFSGQALANESVNYTIYTRDTYDSEYEYDHSYELSSSDRYGLWGAENIKSGFAQLNNQGKAEVELVTEDLSKKSPGKMQIVTIEAQYSDSSGNPVLARKNILVYPSKLSIFRKEGSYSSYTGIVNKKYSLPLVIKGRDTQKVNGLELEAEVKYTWWEEQKTEGQKYSNYISKEETLPNIKVKTNKNGEASLDFTPSKTGSYKISVTVSDEQGHPVKKEFGAWIIEKDYPWYSGEYNSGITISAERPSYLPGETVHLTIYSEVPDRDVFLALERGRMDRYQVVSLQGKTTSVDIPLQDSDMPDIFAKVSSFSSDTHSNASTKIVVSPDKKQISVKLTPDKKSYGPGETATLNVETTDQNGKPVAAEVAVWSVDKAIFELSDSNLGKIFETFWQERWDQTQEAHSLEGINVLSAEGGGGCFTGDTQVLMSDGKTKPISEVKVGEYVLTRTSETDATLVSAKVTGLHQVEETGYMILNTDLKVTANHIMRVNNTWMEAGSVQKGDTLVDSTGKSTPVTSVEWLNRKTTVYNLEIENYHTFFANNIWVHNQKGEARSVLKDTAYWNPTVQTDSSGRAQVHFQLPDNLTTWVLAGVASNQATQVGQGTTEMLVSKDVIVRPVVPNILRVGDETQLSAIVQNFTDEDQNFDISLNFSSGEVREATHSGVTVKANDSQEIFWPVMVKKADPQSKVVVWARGKTEKLSDGIEVTLPVQEFGFYEKRARVSDQNTAYQISLSPDAHKEKTEITLSLASNMLGTLPTAMQYLISYPYGCVEQTTSSLAPIVLARANPTLFEKALEGKDTEKMASEGIRRLEEMQQPDGGWGLWSTSNSDPFITTYVVENLVQAKAAKITVPDEVLDGAERYLLQTRHYDPNVKNTIEDGFNIQVLKAYGLWQLKAESSQITPFLTGDLSELTVDNLAYAVIVKFNLGEKDPEKNGLNKLTSLAQIDGENASWGSGSDLHFGSTDASTALAVRAILAANGDRSLAVKGARYLMRNRKYEYWGNTFGTSQVIRAILDLSKTGNETNPTYSYTIKLDGTAIAQGTVNSSTKLLPDVKIPANKIQAKGSKLEIEKNGDGQIYSTLLEKEFHTDKNAKATGNGLTITREYVVRNHDEYTPVPGDTVDVHLTVSGLKSDQHYAVIEDHLPAGMIPINTSLKNETYGDISQRYGDYYSGIGGREVTQDGMILTLYNLPAGTHTYAYAARVVSQGTFLVPPAHVEAMYSPELQANSAPESIKVAKTAQIIPERAAKKALLKAQQTFESWWKNPRVQFVLILSLLIIGFGAVGLKLEKDKWAKRKVTQASQTPEEVTPDAPKEVASAQTVEGTPTSETDQSKKTQDE
jgi:uncharacterized protein YfaS (alpha-2-macroglobulin family)